MSAPPPSLAVQCTPPPPPPPPSQPPPCVASVPTYEIVTSCQPSVMYSNGYYYTSFAPPPPPPPAPTSSTGTPSTPTSTQPLAYSSVVANSQQVMPAPQYSAVAAGQPVQYTTGTSTGGAQVQQYTGTSTGAQVQYSSGTSPVQYSTTSSSVQYSPASTVQYTTSTPIVQYTTTCPLPQQQYSTVRLFRHLTKILMLQLINSFHLHLFLQGVPAGQGYSQVAAPCYSCSCSYAAAPQAALGHQTQWITTAQVAPQPSS